MPERPVMCPAADITWWIRASWWIRCTLDPLINHIAQG